MRKSYVKNVEKVPFLVFSSICHWLCELQTCAIILVFPYIVNTFSSNMWNINSSYRLTIKHTIHVHSELYLPSQKLKKLTLSFTYSDATIVRILFFYLWKWHSCRNCRNFIQFPPFPIIIFLKITFILTKCNNFISVW